MEEMNYVENQEMENQVEVSETGSLAVGTMIIIGAAAALVAVGGFVVKKVAPKAINKVKKIFKKKEKDESQEEKE